MALICCSTKKDPFPVIPNSFLRQTVINLPVCSTEKTYTSGACVFLKATGVVLDQVLDHQIIQSFGKILKCKINSPQLVFKK